MTLTQAKEKARLQSLEGYGQHVNFKVTEATEHNVGGYFYVSDWFDSDSTVFTYVKGERTL